MTAFVTPIRVLHRPIQMDGQRCFGPEPAQVGAGITGPGLGCFKFHAKATNRAALILLGNNRGPSSHKKKTSQFLAVAVVRFWTMGRAKLSLGPIYISLYLSCFPFMDYMVIKKFAQN
jgi:hypothetical protein